MMPVRREVARRRSAASHRAAADVLHARGIDALGDAHAVLGLQCAQTGVQFLQLGLGEDETLARVDLRQESVLVVRRA